MTLSAKRIGTRLCTLLVLNYICLYVWKIPTTNNNHGGARDHNNAAHYSDMLSFLPPGVASSSSMDYHHNYTNYPGVINEGEYVFRRRHRHHHHHHRDNSISRSSSVTNTTTTLNKSVNDAEYYEPRVLLFITTHMSDQHEWYLKTCWQQVLATSKLLRHSDVMVFLNPSEKEKRVNALRLLNSTFVNQTLTVQVRSSQKEGTLSKQQQRAAKQAGAMLALSQATTYQWFRGYDWVIRLNPDVIVRNETFLLDTIQNDRNATALLINCDEWKKETRVHTDFFALKPGALPMTAFFEPRTDNAERSFTQDIAPILESGGHRWIRDAFPKTHLCQAGNGKALTQTPITHFHGLDSKTDVCPIPFA